MTPSRGCQCSLASVRRWNDTGHCATCGHRVLESQLAPVLLQILCGGTGLVLWRNNIGFDESPRPDGSQRHIHYGVGGKGGADYVGLYAGRFVAVEMKSRGGRHESDQRAFEQLVQRTGGIYAVVRSEGAARQLLEYLRSLPT